MEEIIKKLQMYSETYRNPPYGREVEGTAELLDEAASIIQESQNSMETLEKRFMEGIPVKYEGQDADDYILCPHCGYGIASNDDYIDLRPKHCPECGTKLLY